MTAKRAEYVLVVPTRCLHEAGIFQGFTSRADYYLPLLVNPSRLTFLPRDQAESDPNYKQIIPYLILKSGNEVFRYTRGKRGTESRLQELLSIGIGGHIDMLDRNLFGDLYDAGMQRELAEEVELRTPYTSHIIGLINDDSTPVGQVHLGIVHLFELEKPSVICRDAALTHSGFLSLQDLLARRHELESWSRFVLDELIFRPVAS
jgi:predicted NUDIX family phosphoesterase